MADNFDPDAYLAAKSPSASGFNPDAYLAQKQGDKTSVVGATARGALDAVPFGDKVYAAGAANIKDTPYDKELGNLDHKIALDKSQHPIAHDVGEVGGTVAPLMIPGVGEALGAESLAGRAAVGAGLGAVQGASSNRDSSTMGSDIAKSAGIGAVAGPVLGAAGDALGVLFRGATKVAHDTAVDAGEHVISSAAAPAENLFNDATKAAPTNPVEVETAAMGREAPKAYQPPPPTPPTPSADNVKAPVTPTTPPATPSGNTPTAAGEPLGVQSKQGFFPSPEELKAEILAGALGGSPRQLRALPGQDLVGSINKMGDIISKNSTPDNQLIAMGDRYSTRLQKFAALGKQKGAVIGDAINNSGLGPMNTAPIKQSIQDSLKFATPEQSGQIKAVIATLDKYSAMDKTTGAIDIKTLQRFKTELGDEAFAGQGSPALKSAYHAVSDIEDQALEHADKHLNMPEFRNAKEAYQMTQRAIPMLRMATARSLAKGYSSYGTPLAALVTGHPFAAIGALAKEPLSRAANAAAFGVSHAQGAASDLPINSGITQAILNHPAMAQFKGAFSAATQGLTDPAEIEKAHAVTDYLNSQRFPTYSATKDKVQNELGGK